MRMPSLFVSHGSPAVVPDCSPVLKAWQSWAHHHRKPDAIIIMSSHHPSLLPYVSTSEACWCNEYDFDANFSELSQLKYMPPGSTSLLHKTLKQLKAAKLKAHARMETRLDHGVWIPLLQMYPAADIPVVTISVQPRSDALAHWQLGKALSTLANENVLIMGSGCVTHNLFDIRWHDPNPTNEVQQFRLWLINHLTSGNISELFEWNVRAPCARHNHPSPEHILPLFFALGAGGDVSAEVVYSGVEHAALAMEMFAFN